MIRAKKSLGQNFLVDRRVIERIVDAVSPAAGDVVIEIGPGTGALTGPLVSRAGYVVAVETDSRLVAELRRRLTATNLSIVEADALELDWHRLIDAATASWRRLPGSGPGVPRVRVVANLPYYISTPILQAVLGFSRRVSDMTLMLQDEVVDRIVSSPGVKDYGYLSILVQFYCEAAKLFSVPPSAFKPAPKVRSAILRLIVRSLAPVEVGDEAKFFSLIRSAFARRRKNILNNLKAAAGVLGSDVPVEGALGEAGIEPRRRAETLSLAEFAALCAALYPESK